jgi:hypothetical protein
MTVFTPHNGIFDVKISILRGDIFPEAGAGTSSV